MMAANFEVEQRYKKFIQSMRPCMESLFIEIRKRVTPNVIEEIAEAALFEIEVEVEEQREQTKFILEYAKLPDNFDYEPFSKSCYGGIDCYPKLEFSEFHTMRVFSYLCLMLQEADHNHDNPKIVGLVESAIELGLEHDLIRYLAGLVERGEVTCEERPFLDMALVIAAGLIVEQGHADQYRRFVKGLSNILEHFEVTVDAVIAYQTEYFEPPPSGIGYFGLISRYIDTGKWQSLLNRIERPLLEFGADRKRLKAFYRLL